jgi:hypothetical protein
MSALRGETAKKIAADTKTVDKEIPLLIWILLLTTLLTWRYHA